MKCGVSCDLSCRAGSPLYSAQNLCYCYCIVLLPDKENGSKHTPGAERGCEIRKKPPSWYVEMHKSNLISIKKKCSQGNSTARYRRSDMSMVRAMNERDELAVSVLSLGGSELSETE